MSACLYTAKLLYKSKCPSVRPSEIERGKRDFLGYSIIHFLVAKLLYNSLCLSVSQFVSQSVRQSVTLWEKSDFSAPIQDTQLKFLVKIPVTYVHLVYTQFCPSVCYLGCQTIPRFSSFRDFLYSFFKIEYFVFLGISIPKIRSIE